MLFPEVQFLFELHLYEKRQNLLYPRDDFPKHLQNITDVPDITIQHVMEKLHHPIFRPTKKEKIITLLNHDYSYSQIRKMIKIAPNTIQKANRLRPTYEYPYAQMIEVHMIWQKQTFQENWQSFIDFAKKHNKQIF
jgi:hypothetical protein